MIGLFEYLCMLFAHQRWTNIFGNLIFSGLPYYALCNSDSVTVLNLLLFQ